MVESGPALPKAAPLREVHPASKILERSDIFWRRGESNPRPKSLSVDVYARIPRSSNPSRARGRLGGGIDSDWVVYFSSPRPRCGTVRTIQDETHTRLGPWRTQERMARDSSMRGT